MAGLDLGGCPQAFSSCSDPWLLSSCSVQAPHCNGFSSFRVPVMVQVDFKFKLFPNQYFKIKIKLQAWNWLQGLMPAAQEPHSLPRPWWASLYAVQPPCAPEVHPRFFWCSWTQKKTGSTQLLAADSVSVWLLSCSLEACEHASWPHLGCLLKSLGGGYFWPEESPASPFPPTLKLPLRAENINPIDHTPVIYLGLWIRAGGRDRSSHFSGHLNHLGASLVDQLVKNRLVIQETPVPYLGWEDPLERGWATHSVLGLPWWLRW